MKWLRVCSAIVATLGLTTATHADILDLLEGGGYHGGSKCCGAPSCQPACCKPTIKRPCQYKVHTFQRQISDKKPPCCAPKCCAPAPKCCAPARQCCPPPPKTAPPKHECCAPPPKCCAPEPSCRAPAPKDGCQAGCCGEARCCDADPCVIAQLIYQSQTACYDDDREDAIDQLGDYDCVCNPEIMAAMIYALNDASEEVRAEAADEIGDQLRENPCCCSKEVIEALKAALADCDYDVRDQAEEALRACGYCVVDGCCGGCGYAAEDSETAPPPPTGGEAAPLPPVGDDEAAPAPAPEAYRPAPLRLRQTGRPMRSIRGGLAELWRALD